MKDWTAHELADAAGADLVGRGAGADGPTGASLDSRSVAAGELFVGLPGKRVDGGAFADAAIAAGAWGVLVGRDVELASSGDARVLIADDPLLALQRLARAWRRKLGARVVAVTGSTGKTSTKDILRAVLGPSLTTVASEGNLNTEVGLPLAILRAPAGTQALVLELAMRGPGQIAQLAGICEPDVAVIVNVGPAHLELLGSLEAIAAAKSELLRALKPGASAVVPAAEPLLEPHLKLSEVELIRFGDGGDVTLLSVDAGGVELGLRGRRVRCEPGFRAPHQLLNLLAAAGAGAALEVAIPPVLHVAFSARRGDRLELPGNLVVFDDCYNANPMSMRAALQDLARAAHGRRVAVLGEMLELGPEEARFHRELGELARASGVEVLIAVGERSKHTAEAFGEPASHVPDAAEAARLLPSLLRGGDTVLVKGSRAGGLEVVARELIKARA
ncbi:MAG: UDP-N-acetylmuramoyl-tripeptide--D-alanyl-D-alanine ligase [Solirubrobacteraceae bacterium]